uniref:Uncharacterized protein n=1 Tax=Oryzias melastigma TaxID=30732 RepID=A0A3B3D9N8_ORYME
MHQLVTFLDDDQVENAEVGVNNATTDRFAFALTSPAGTVAGVTLAKKQTHTAVSENALLHGKSLLVVTPYYNQGNIYLPLISQRVSSHLSGHSLFIEGAFWQPVAGNEMFSYMVEEKKRILKVSKGPIKKSLTHMAIVFMAYLLSKVILIIKMV